MKDNIEQLLSKTYHNSNLPTEELNRTVLQKVKKQETGKKFTKKRNTLYTGSLKFTKVAAILALTLLIGTTAVLAANEFLGLNYFSGNVLSQKTKKLIDTNPSVTVESKNNSKDILNYQVQEVLCDSKYIITTIHISVKDSNHYFLLPETVDVTEPVSSLEVGIDSDKSIEEYCSDQHLTPISVYMDFDKSAENNVQKTESDNKQSNFRELTTMIAAKRLTNDKNFTIHLQPRIVFSAGNTNASQYKGNLLKIDVEDKTFEETASYHVVSDEKQKLSDASIQIDKITLHSTDIATYLTVRYTNHISSSESATEKLIYLCDKNGNILPSNLVSEGNCRAESNNHFISKSCYDNIGLPNEIYLKIGDTKQIIKAVR